MQIKENIIIEWFHWQFYEMPSFLFEVWMNYFNFSVNLFSVPLLLKTFFAPWRKYNWRYPKGFDFVEFSNTFVSNIFSRILGSMMRIVLIITGILFQIFVAVTGAVVFVGWMVIPLIIVLGILFFILW